MNTLFQDVRFGLRTLRKNLGINLIAIFALALGIGANTAIFSIVNALLLSPLSFPELDRVVAISESLPNQGIKRNETAVANYFDWQSQNQTFENIATYGWWNANLSGIDPPERVQGYLVTTNLLETLKVTPALGRNFIADEAQPGKDQVVILSYGLWQRRFAADPDILHKTITVNGVTRSIIGVLPEDYNYPPGVEVLAPLALTPQQASNRGNHSYLTVGRLKDGVMVAEARADLGAIAARLEQQYPQSNTGRSVTVETLLDDTVRHYRAMLFVLLLAVGFVLLIACANVANLLLARAAGRRKEIAVRLALGANRWRIIRQLMTESVLLSLLGGTVGILLGLWGTEALKAWMPGDVVRFIIGWRNVGLNFPVLAYTFSLSLFVGILFGLAPALQSSKPDLTETLKEGGGKNVPGGRQRLRSILVVSEIALSLLLLVGAGLALKSFWQLLRINPGFKAENVLTMTMTLPRAKYPEPAKRRDFYEELTRRVGAIPGVGTVGMVNYLPLGGANSSSSYLIEGMPEPLPGQELDGRYRACTPDYFLAMGMTILEGRSFSNQDTPNSQPVAIINETLARKHWPQGDATGKRFRISGPLAENPWRTIVGVIRDVKHELYSPVKPEYYLPASQDPWSTMILVAQTQSEPMALASVIRNEVTALDKDQPVFDVRTMEQVRSQSVLPFSFSGVLLSVFAIVALLLAGVGIYGVMSYAVSQRTHEIGVRMALGASRRDVMKMIIRHGMALTAIGLGLGSLGAWFLIRAMTALLFEVAANDFAIFFGVPVVLAAVALLACFIPARRATKVDPMIALRYE